MSKGIESAFVTSWRGWDGDQECLQFYNCALTSEVSENLGIETAEVVELDLVNMTVTFHDNWQDDGDTAKYMLERTFKLNLTMAQEIK